MPASHVIEGALPLLPQVGPPPAYSPYNCKPEFVRMTSYAVPNSQARQAAARLAGALESSRGL